jgi:hypothetical protein
MPAATQREVVEGAAEVIKPAQEELIRQAAQGEVLHNDDTGMRVLYMERELRSRGRRSIGQSPWDGRKILLRCAMRPRQGCCRRA